MKFTTAVSTGLSKIFTFEGRASRSEFWWYYLFITFITLCMGLVLFFISAVMLPETNMETAINATTLLIGLCCGFLTISVFIRRFNDANSLLGIRKLKLSFHKSGRGGIYGFAIFIYGYFYLVRPLQEIIIGEAVDIGASIDRFADTLIFTSLFLGITCPKSDPEPNVYGDPPSTASQTKASRNTEDALRILDELFARGEINENEYRSRKEILQKPD